MREEMGQRHLLTDCMVGKLPTIQCLLRIILSFWLNQKQKIREEKKLLSFLFLFHRNKGGSTDCSSPQRGDWCQQKTDGSRWNTVVMRTLAPRDQAPGCPVHPKEKASQNSALLKCYNHFTARKWKKAHLCVSFAFAFLLSHFCGTAGIQTASYLVKKEIQSAVGSATPQFSFCSSRKTDLEE